MAKLIDEIVLKLHHLPEPRLREVLGFVDALSESTQSSEANDISKEPLLQTTETVSGKSSDATSTRIHAAFLNGYSPEDEGLYDDHPAR